MNLKDEKVTLKINAVHIKMDYCQVLVDNNLRYVCICVWSVQVFLILWGHRSVYIVMLWGVDPLMGTKVQVPLI